VFTNGCFDVLHPGHLQVLNKARSLAGPRGAVVVGLNSDESVRRLKGPDRPVFDEHSRAILLVSLKMVDHVVVFEEDTPLELIRILRPDIIVKGGDYTPNNVVGSDISLVVVGDYDPRWSTSQILKKVKNE
jgi:rfaE bifunctional protein nucleotidyltransferase chain/domain